MKPDTAIKIENLGKEYKIGERQNYLALRDVLTNALKKPANWLKREPDRQEEEHIWALRDIDLEVQKGEVVGVIGKNGAGKSTLLKVLSRITEPTEGSITYRGRVSSLLEVGTGFHPELTGRENIYLNGAILGMRRKEIDKKFDEIVDFSGVEKFLDTPVKRYSSGMRVRLAFSVAAHLESEILLIDEVLAVGDTAFQEKSLGKMEETTQQGRTVIFVSHNMGQIKQLCERVILLEQGSIKDKGHPSEIIVSYMQTTPQSITRSTQGTLLESKDKNITLTKIQICADKEASPAKTGKECNIHLTFIFDEKYDNPAPIASIKTVDGTELMRFSTSPTSGVYTGEHVGNTKFNLTIDKLPLSGGTYILSVGLALPKIEYLIPITEVTRFDVIPTDFYGSGEIIRNNKGNFVTKHKWTWDRKETETND